MDIGGGTTDIAVFAGGAIRHTAVIPIAGDQVTNDIAMTLRTPTKEAEELKLRHGCALRQLADPNDIIEVPGVGDRAPRKLSRQTLRRGDRAADRGALHARAGGAAPLRLRGAALSSGIVLTGGTALLQGMTELGEEVFHLPVPRRRAGVHGRASPTSCAARATRPPSGFCSKGATSTCARESRAPRTTGIGGVAGTDEAMVQGEFLRTAQQQQRINERRPTTPAHRQSRDSTGKGAHHV